MSMARSLVRSIVRPLPAAITGLSGGGGGDAYAANDISPDLAVDFNGSLNSGTPFYRKQGSTTTLDAFSFPEPGGLRTMVNSSGNIVWNAHNLAVNSETPATQSITVVSGGEYTVEMEGAGSFALTGAGTGTASDGSPATVTASTTTLTITLAGAADRVWVYRSDLGGMSDVESSYRTAGAPANYLATTGAARYLPRFGHHTYSGSAWVDKGVLVERVARTNLLPYSRDFSTFTGTNAPGVSQNAVGIDGVSNTATTITDNDGAAEESLSEDVTCPDDSNPAVGVVYVKKTTSATHFPAINLQFIGGTNVAGRVCLDTDNGTVAEDAGNAPNDAGVVDAGDFWRVHVVLNNNGTGNTTLRFRIAPAYNTDASGTRDTSATGSTVFDQADVNLNTSTPASPVITTGTATARTSDPSLTVAAADAPYSASGLSLAVIGEVTRTSSGVQEVWSRYASTGNRFLYQHNGTATRVVINTLAVTASGSAPSGIDQPFAVAARADSGSAAQAASNGSAGTASSSFTLGDLSSTDLDIAGDSFMGTVSRIVGWAEDIAEAGIEQASTEDNTAP